MHQEHFASALATRRLEALLASTPPPSRAGRILVGCPPEEAHTFVPLMLSLLLRRKGWDVLYLGANLPLQNMDLTIGQTRPDLVVLTAQQLYTAAGLLDMAHVLSRKGIPIAYGGLVFNRLPSLRAIIPGYYLGATLDNVSETVAHVMTAPRPQLAQQAVSPEHQRALEHFRDQRATIDAQVWRNVENRDVPRQYLASANASLGRDILAALSLGDIDLLSPDLGWVEGLLINHHPGGNEGLWPYLAAYRDAASEHLDQRGDLVVNWLDRVVETQKERRSTGANIEQARRPTGQR
ncbi:MAG: cobalamin B12-binding domain-containing protein [Caldilineaceae bacterium]|nr:cobalamin B12-binding domain-containing protein [Caldilineaceae bacterium]